MYLILIDSIHTHTVKLNLHKKTKQKNMATANMVLK